MATGILFRKNQYYDSVFLMGISKRISDTPGVTQNAVLMGSETNKGLLASIGIRGEQIAAAGPNDLVVAVVAETPELVQGVLGRLDEYLQGGVPVSSTSNPHSFEEGLAQRPDANLAVISVPGEYAAREARRALEAGLNVFLFSDNVSVEEELKLKEFASRGSLLVMGPDCGTSLIGGVGLGFANGVRRGNIGAIGAAGTGLQEFTSQVHNRGGGISHAIGTGGRDLSDGIGGITAFAALEALEADPGTQVITFISKPPGSKTFARLSARLKECRKPVIGCFLGAPAAGHGADSGFQPASTIDEAVRLALNAAGAGAGAGDASFTTEELRWIVRERSAWSPRQHFLRGLFAGGTFCYQSQQILQEAAFTVHSNAPLQAKYKLSDPNRSLEHTLVDMGADEFTLGKPHPMIDGTLRKQRILSEARDGETAILLLDFILGYNVSMDPVGEVLDAILQARETAERAGGCLTVVASVCGTDLDPQDVKAQVKLLTEAGVIVFQSNARAARFCCELLK